MSGHSKWATIKRKKAVTDARRGKMFTQIIKEITVAAKLGGGNPDGNPRLRFAIDKAKESNMPADNIKRAIMKGTGELPGTVYEDVMYEAYGAGGVALMIEAVTDNKTRTVSELRHILERHHGKLASSGAVAFQFHKKGLITIPVAAIAEDDLMSLVLDAGADDMKTEGDFYTIVTAPENFEAVRKAIDAKTIKLDSAEIHMMAENTVKVEGKDAENVIKLMEALEEHDDVQKVHSNFDIDDKVLASLAAQ
ncbi:MAG TPA: YebC/PmpR family DNA-binding transcriptional regulator [Bacteroidota bacterium]